MAKIALAVGIAAIGAVTGGIGAGLFGLSAGTLFGGSIMTGIVQGAALGYSVGVPAEHLTFAGKKRAEEDNEDRTAH